VLQSQQIEHVVFYPGDNSPAPASWMLNAKQERKRAPKGNGRKNYSKKPARMPLHHGCLMPNEQKKDHPKVMEEITIAKNLQECPCIMDA